jgi:hypothetical protein
VYYASLSTLISKSMKQAIMGEERRQEMMQNLFGEDQSEDEVDSEQEAVKQSTYVSVT